MIIIGEKINGAIPAVGKAIAERNADEIIDRVRRQVAAGADFIDCAASTETALEYDAMCWLLDVIQSETDTPVSIDSPDAHLLARLISEGRVKKAGLVNSVSLEGDKCDVIFPLIAGTDWQAVALTCDDSGIPADCEKRVELAMKLIEKADAAGVERSKIHIDPCVMALSTTPSAMQDFVYCIRRVHELAPEVKLTGAVSNISFNMPARKFVNMACLAQALDAGLDSAIMDPTSENMAGIMYACAALSGEDKGGRKYNRAYRKGLFGQKK